jgi:tetratricopeptide (TPR) repeat protein
MIRLLFAPLFCACALLGPVTALAGPADQLIQQGDIHDLKLESKAALEQYLPAEKLEPTNVGLLLRIARQYRHEMADAGPVEEKSRLAHLALNYAQRAVALDPKDGEAHLSVAICHGKAMGHLANKEKMNALRHIKVSVDRAIALNPNQDLAWYVLGCWNQRVTELGGFKRTMAQIAYGGLPEADDTTAVKCFQKAIALNPDRLIHYIELGRTYAQMGNATEAKKFIRKGLSMTNTGKDDAESKLKGKQTLAAL